jgi:erythrin-vacuolar iron transport family protein
VATKGIDFGKLSLKGALDLAVLIEEEARERYEEFAQQMHQHRTLEAGRFFLFMAGNEEKHRLQLTQRRRALFPSEPVAATRQMIFDVEAPEYEEARAFMTAREALQAALRSEKKAHDFFVQALTALPAEEVRDLFEELRQEEIEHQRLVVAEEKTPPDPAIKASDGADGPVAL